MRTNADPILFDTSAALAFVDSDNPMHGAVWELGANRPRGLAGHAVFGFLSVLTRLPLPKRLSPSTALRLLRAEFPENRHLPAEAIDQLADEFTALGIAGGGVYDGLVGACARHHHLTFLTCDRRAVETYRRLAAPYQLVGER